MRVNKSNCDFKGWATKNNIVCGDGRTILQNAFASQDGQVVPLVWNHKHDSTSTILGHALLENRPEGVYAYGFFNNTQAAKDAKEQLRHGDIRSLSILANNLVQEGKTVAHGVIRELSLVLAGANPGAYIESVMAHGEPMDEYDEEGIIHSGEEIIMHSANPNFQISGAMDPDPNDISHADEEGGDDKTVADVLDTLTEDQKVAVGLLLESVAGEGGDDNEDDEGGDDNMTHSGVWEKGIENQEGEQVTYLTHSDLQGIVSNAKKVGSFREALKEFEEEHGGVLAHALDTTGMTTPANGNYPSKNQNYGVRGLEMLYPDARVDGSATPFMITRNMEWVDIVLNGVSRSPFSRVKTLYADITEDEARAKGYIKGKQKKEEVFSVLKRTTEPTTIYKKQKIDRDDMLDITDFDVIAWIKQELQIMLREEKARAILMGDGRLADSEDKIDETKIRPVISDVPLFNVKVGVPVQGASEAEKARSTVNTIIRSRKKYKGSGNPIFFTTSDVVTEMLLLEDKIGQKVYKTQAELETALRVSRIVEVEPMEGHQIEQDGKKNLIGVLWNPIDYKVGADRNAETSELFDDFDIDYNQYKYLLEGRMSGALVRPFSAVTLYEDTSAEPVSYVNTQESFPILTSKNSKED